MMNNLFLYFHQMQKKERIRQLYKSQQNTLPSLSVLAQDIRELAVNEKEMFSPILKRWHPLAAGVAVATLHSCFGNDLKKFITRISELTPDAMQVLIAADKLEKDLVQIAVEDSVDSEDGGKSIIQEMPPYEAETVISNLVALWITTRVDRLREWVDRNLQQEVCQCNIVLIAYKVETIYPCWLFMLSFYHFRILSLSSAFACSLAYM